jgi:hypothetical protein
VPLDLDHVFICIDDAPTAERALAHGGVCLTPGVQPSASGRRVPAGPSSAVDDTPTFDIVM